MRQLILTLPSEQGEVLVLHTVQGLSISEIAESTNAPKETVRSRLRLARTALRRRIHGGPTLSLVGERK